MFCKLPFFFYFPEIFVVFSELEVLETSELLGILNTPVKDFFSHLQNEQAAN